MIISFNNLLRINFSHIQEKISLASKPLNKKIAIVALVCTGFLAACFLVRYFSNLSKGRNFQKREEVPPNRAGPILDILKQENFPNEEKEEKRDVEFKQPEEAVKIAEEAKAAAEVRKIDSNRPEAVEDIKNAGEPIPPGNLEKSPGDEPIPYIQDLRSLLPKIWIGGGRQLRTLLNHIFFLNIQPERRVIPNQPTTVAVLKWRDAFLCLERDNLQEFLPNIEGEMPIGLKLEENGNVDPDARKKYVIWNDRNGVLKLVQVAKLKDAWEKSKPLAAFISANNAPDLFQKVFLNVLTKPPQGQQYNIVGVLDSHSTSTNRLEGILINDLHLKIPHNYPDNNPPG